MSIPNADLGYIFRRFSELSELVTDSWDGHSEPSPELVAEAVFQLLDVLERLDLEPGQEAMETLPHKDMDELADYGLRLVEEMSAMAADCGLEEEAEQLESLCYPLALWLARHDADLNVLEPVVNSIARLANDLTEPQELIRLSCELDELIEAVSPSVSQDLERTNPLRPWRILLLNRAIVATRSHKQELIEKAYDAIVEALPEDAARFFEEGMEQMDAIGYPDSVRSIVQHYYLMYGTGQTLH